MLGLIIGSGLLAALATPILLPIASDLCSLVVIITQRLFGLSPATDPGRQILDSGRLLFLIPAHDEEEAIGTAVESALSQSVGRHHYDVVVIADNCSDRTAEIARSAGAECYERTDPAHPGKPRAIEWALSQTNLFDYDAVVIVDADSKVDPDYGAAILRLPGLRNIAFQGFNGVSNPDETALTRLAALLSVAYYHFAYVLKVRSGLNAPLTGAGMGIGTSLLERYGWQAFSLGEDLEKYVFLTLRGVTIELINEQGVRSQEAASLRVASSQRQRWRSGRLQIIGAYSRSLIALGPGWRQRLDIIAELLGFGPAMQVGVALTVSGMAYGMYGLSTAAFAGCLTVLVARPLTYACLALVATDDRLRTIRALSILPVYITWRAVQEVLAILNVRSSDWIRTARK